MAIEDRKILVKFFWEFDQLGEVKGIFVTTRAALENSYGRRASFGDILGEHSEVSGVLKESDFSIVTDDQDFIQKFEQYIGTSQGYNPLARI